MKLRDFAAAVGAGLLLAFFYQYAAVTLGKHLIEPWWFDRMLNFRGPVKPPSDVLLVKVDDETFAQSNLNLGTFFFPRSLYAQAITRLGRLGAKAVVFDISFSDDWPDPKADEEIYAALKTVPTVLAVTADETEEQNGSGQRRGIKKSFRAAAAGLGHMEQLTSLGTVRIFPPSYSFEGRPIEPLAFAASKLLDPALKPPPPGAFINYYGPPGAIPSISLYALLNDSEEALRAKIQGKMAIIGYFRDMSSVAGAADKFLTPLSPPKMPGAEIHATMAANLLNRDFIQPLPGRWLQDNLFSFFVTSGAAAILLCSSEIGALIVSLLALSWMALSYQVFLHSYFLPGFLCFAVFLPGIWLARLIAGYLLLRKKLRRLTQAFEYRISPSTAKALAKNQAALDFSWKEVVVMLPDLHGFTAWMEKASREEVDLALPGYIEVLGEAVTAQGGFVLNPTGDGVLAVFGAPLQVERAEERSLSAAKDIETRLTALKEKGRFPRLKVCFGLHKGVARVGLVGKGGHWVYTAVGDPVNVASRLQEENKAYGTEILLSGEVAECVNSSLPLLPLGSKVIRGREKKISLYTLLEKDLMEQIGLEWKKALSLLEEGKTAKAKEIFMELKLKAPALEKAVKNIIS